MKRLERVVGGYGAGSVGIADRECLGGAFTLLGPTITIGDIVWFG